MLAGLVRNSSRTHINQHSIWFADCKIMIFGGQADHFCSYIRDLYRILRAQRFCRCLFSSRKRERFRDACFSLFPFSNLHLQLYNNSFFCFPSIQEQQNLDFLERRQKCCTRMLFHQELCIYCYKDKFLALSVIVGCCSQCNQ